MDNLSIIIIVILSGMVFAIIQRLIDVFSNMYNNKLEKDWLKYGFVSKKDLHHLEPHEFEKWCAEFLERSGYKIIEITSEGIDGGKDIICSLNNKKIYVECKRYYYEENAPHRVTRDIVQKLAGAMLGDGIHEGIIITSGNVTERAYEYVKSLPDEYKITLIDGDELVKRYRELREREIDINFNPQKA